MSDQRKSATPTSTSGHSDQMEAAVKRPVKRPAASRGKRKTSDDSVKQTTLARKRARNQAAKSNVSEAVWPEYFHSLFKVFKALNTVLAFCSSRKHMATTFPVVRSSVEGLLKKPLEMTKVAELKALLPDLVKFAYIPRLELRVNADTRAELDKRGRKRAASPDFAAFASGGGYMAPAASSSSPPSSPSRTPGSSRIPVGGNAEEEEHVLILEFMESVRGKKPENQFAMSLPPALSPAAMKKLVEKRNDRFQQAVNELIHATPPEEDPVELLQAAAREHIPVNPSSTKDAAGANKTINDDKSKLTAVPDSADRPSIEDVIAEIQEQDWYCMQIVHRRISDAKQGQIGMLDTPLSDTIQQALRTARNITDLYTHQAAAINALALKKHVIVSTSTASGKSVIYQVPMLRFLEEDQEATAIFIYPTKALAQDQRAALEQLLCACPGLDHIHVATYDGDTPQEQRRWVRENASVIFTNFDMLHTSILPHEDAWRRFLKNLKLVAVDELHYYNALFGSHVAMIIRRLRRICAAVGNRRSLFVSCSATMSKPGQHMRNMFGIEEVEEVAEDGAPSGRKDYVIWDPPPKDPQVPALGNRSVLSEAIGLMKFLMKRGVRCILFCKIRKTCEAVMRAIRTELSAEGRLDILERVMSYRGGYSQQDRRRIEREAFSGNLLGIVATNALELGVDIGVLDAVIMLGFPISIASFRQQAGRCGRRARDALSVLVAESYPVDQHFVNNPEELYEKMPDDLVIDLESKVILEAHLQCASHEMPLSAVDAQYFGPLTEELCKERLQKDKDGWYHPHPKYLPFPAAHIAIRGAEEEKYAIVDITKAESRIIEEVEISRALFEIYEGGVFLHQGLTFIVKELSHETKIAKVVRADVNWTTKSRDYTDVNATKTYRVREIKGASQRGFYGRIDLKTVVYGFWKLRNLVVLDVVDLDTPPWERDTTGLWIDVPKHILDLMVDKGINPAEAIHAAQHAFLNRFAMASDLRTECKIPEKEYRQTESSRKRPARLIFYDPPGKGGAIAAKAFDHLSETLRRAIDAVEACPCGEGCDQCIASPSCKEANEVSSKIGAKIVLRGILGMEIDPDTVPDQFDRALYQTVVQAEPVNAAEDVQLEFDKE